MQALILIVHILVAVGLIGLILIQQGKGADAGAAFGAGASATVFGSRGAGSALTRTTAILATVFFITSLWLAYFTGHTSEPRSVLERVESAAPAIPAPVKDDRPALPTTEGKSAEQPAVPAPQPAVPADSAPAPQPAPNVAPSAEKPAADAAEKSADKAGQSKKKP